MILAALIVAGLAVVQSLFGIGLLVFGTPTLLLLGYSFAQALAVLLPASITISLLQLWSDGGQPATFVKVFAWWCLVPLAATLAVVLTLDLHASLSVFIAGLLWLFVALRIYPPLGERARGWVVTHDRIYLVVMGVVHGLSNLGGALLLIFAGARHRSKKDIRALIAFCYACLAASQLTVLAVLTPDVFGWSQLGYGAIAAAVFLIAGQQAFRWVSAPAYDWLLTLMASAYAGLLGLRAAGVF